MCCNSCSETCSHYDVVGNMPYYWNWLLFAKYDGTQTITKPSGEKLLLDLWYLKVIAIRSHVGAYTHVYTLFCIVLFLKGFWWDLYPWSRPRLCWSPGDLSPVLGCRWLAPDGVLYLLWTTCLWWRRFRDPNCVPTSGEAITSRDLKQPLHWGSLSNKRRSIDFCFMLTLYKSVVYTLVLMVFYRYVHVPSKL